MRPTQTGNGAMGHIPASAMTSSFPTARFPSGTTVLTLDGEIPAEYLSAGDRLITRDSGMVRLAAVSHDQIATDAVSILGGSLGDTRPETDMILPADQHLLIRDWRAKALFGDHQAIARADRLVDGEFIRNLGPMTLRLTLLHFNRPHVIYAGGLEIATSHQADCAQAA